MPWYKDFFDKWYLDLYQDSPRFKKSYIKKEVAFVKRVLDLPKGAKILDLCSGHGRHTIPLAEAGYQMTALDLNKKALNILENEAEKQGLDIRIIQSDMRKIPFQNEFDAVINMFTSFGYFKNDKENSKVLEQVVKSLKPGGKFLLDIRNGDLVINYTPLRYWYKTKDYFVLEERRFNQKTRQETVNITIIDRNGKNYSAKYTTRLYSSTEIKKILKKAGFSKIIRLYGNTTEIQKFTPKSPRLVILAQK
jgi:ubiquinone/menaquinone biosynthesis C-methylase UbiE